MGYLQKEKAIIEKLKESDYKLFDNDKDDALDSLAGWLDKFPEYANTVIRQQVMVPIWMAKYDGQELRDRSAAIDKDRRIAHESAIDSVNVLNRMSKNLGLEPFADIDTTDRYAVADMVGDYVNEVYNAGIGKGMLGAVKERHADYDKGKTIERLRQLDSKFGDIVQKSDETQQEMQ